MAEAIRRGPAVAVMIAACIIGAVLIVRRGKVVSTENKPASQQPAVILPGNDSWPMFRGGQGLLGRAAGDLADSVELAWKFKTSDQIKSSPAINSGIVYIGSSDANVYAIDLESGEQIWQYHTSDAVEAAPLVLGGSVYVGALDGFLFAIDANSGSFKWKYETDSQIAGAVNWTRSPDGRDLWILVGSHDNYLHCLNSADGKVVWKYETGNYINGAPAVGGGQAVVGGCDAMIHVVSTADGAGIRQIET
ncbi:MAG: PQQ-binding-like beta-propeller repeat protein, partial [Sedimentisphaerales bacterium]|nr:PQQ-binding-like beta-propeller repeat protein [Sedimentisphaerales bacterium]